MNILWYKFLGWFYGTFLGGLFFEFLLWVDSKKAPKQFLTYKEVAQVIREYSLVSEGMNRVKRKVNQLIVSKSADEYNKILSDIEDMLDLAEDDTNSEKAILVNALRQVSVKKGNKDITTLTERAKMVDQRINDMYELQNHVAKRQLLREIRRLRTEGNNEKADELKKEYDTKYGR